MAKRTNHTIGLDIGTSKVTCIVGAPSDEGVLQVLGVGEAESRGLRKGVIVNPDAAVKRSSDRLKTRSG
jgi:cell division protein FtsA